MVGTKSLVLMEIGVSWDTEYVYFVFLIMLGKGGDMVGKEKEGQSGYT